MKHLFDSKSHPEGPGFLTTPQIRFAHGVPNTDELRLMQNLKPSGIVAERLVRGAVASSAKNVLAIYLLLLGLAMITPVRAPAQVASATSSSTGAAEAFATTGQLSALNAVYGKLPLSFEANQGQSDPQVRFTSRGNGYALFLTDKEAVLALTKRDATDKKLDRKAGLGKPSLSPAKDARLNLAKTDVVRMELAGASDGLRVSGAEQLPGRANYFIGNDPAKWHSNIPIYGKVRYSGVYPGVDLVYYGNQQQLEYDFVVAPGASPNPVRLRFAGAEKLQLNADGDLKVVARNGEIAFHKPVVYQMKDGQRQPVQGHFAVLAKNTVGFALGGYDQSRELVIDPTLAYSTYLGGSGRGFPFSNGYGDSARGIAVDASGHAYVAGVTYSADFPLTSGAFQKVNNSHTSIPFTAFVTKLNLAGSALYYSTYLGGSVYDVATAIAVDSGGHAYVTGYTGSSDFPVTIGAFQSVNNGENAFVTKLNLEGSALDYSTYLGGSCCTQSNAVTVDASGHAYVTGDTNSTDFPVTSGAFQKVNNGAGNETSNAFVTKLNFSGSDVKYSTYLGGSGLSNNGTALQTGDSGNGIAVDVAGHAYVTGLTTSTDFPVTSGAFQKVNKSAVNMGSNAFVTKLNTTGSALDYSTYLGGTGEFAFTLDIFDTAYYLGDVANGIAVDVSGHAYVTGFTGSTDFPVTSGAFQKVNNAAANDVSNAFVTKLNLEGSVLEYSTYLGGSGGDSFPVGDGANGIAVDASGHAYVTGSTISTDFPATSGAFQKVNDAVSGGTNAFIAEFNFSGSDLKYSTYLGGSIDDEASGIAMDAAGNVYIAGSAYSPDFPVTSGAFQKVNHAAASVAENAFVTKFTW